MQIATIQYTPLLIKKFEVRCLSNIILNKLMTLLLYIIQYNGYQFKQNAVSLCNSNKAQLRNLNNYTLLEM